eukprot:gene27198-biopygen17738
MSRGVCSQPESSWNRSPHTVLHPPGQLEFT